MPLIPC